MLRLLRATLNSWNGLRAAARSEWAFRREVVIFVIAIPLAFVIAADPWRRAALLGVLILLMIVELLNTALEKLCDHVTADAHPAIGRVKDMGSAAVGLAMILAGLMWIIALAERLEWL